MEEHEEGTSVEEVGAWVEQTSQAPPFLVGSLLTPIGSSRAFFECHLFWKALGRRWLIKHLKLVHGLS